MKNLGMWVVFMMALGFSNSYAQKSMKVDCVENLRAQRLTFHLTYDDNVPYFDHQTILELAKQGNLETTTTYKKKNYDLFILYRILYDKVYKILSPQWKEKPFPLWLWFAIVSMIVMEIRKKVDSDFYGAFGAVPAIVLFAGVFLDIDSPPDIDSPVVSGVIFTFICAFFLVAGTQISNENRYRLSYYHVCVTLAMIFRYFQI